jgi:hypothetical protein
MYQCQASNCKKYTEKGQPMNKIVTEFRNKSYECTIQRGYNRGQTQMAYGTEIVKEIAVCPECFEHITGQKPSLAVSQVVKAPKPVYKANNEQRPRQQPRYNNQQRQYNGPPGRQGHQGRGQGFNRPFNRG